MKGRAEIKIIGPKNYYYIILVGLTRNIFFYIPSSRNQLRT